MDLPCDGPVLLVGDGDFSFTLSLLNKLTFKGSQVTTSSLETLDSIQQHKLATYNMQALTEIGVQVFLETDARELHTHPVISQIHYQRVIFNFPLADRHNIKRNRALLADFFSSCSHILSDFGQVMVTLCKGQGGTPADQPMRSWHDSWQVHAMASNAGFILRDIVPFDVSNYPEYHSVGFRFQDKSFNTDGSLTHIFEKHNVAVVSDVCARGVVESSGSCYTCSHYLAQRINRNLLQESNNPLCMLRKRLEALFNRELAAKIISEKPNWRILPGHRSRTSLNHYSTEGLEEAKLDSKADGSNHCGDAAKCVKERKNTENLTMKRSIASFQHGIDRSETFQKHLVKLANQTSQGEKHKILKFVPENSESVFILIKGNNDSTSSDVDTMSIRDLNNIKVSTLFETDLNNTSSGENDLTVDESVEFCSGSAISRNVKTHERNSGTFTDDCVLQMNLVPCETKVVNGRADKNIQECASRVFHCRTSLLENICDLIYVNEGSSTLEKNFSKKPPVSEFSACGKILAMPSELISGDIEGCGIKAHGYHNEADLDLSEDAPPESQCFVVSGQCFLPGPIEPATLAIRHEMMVVQTFPGNISYLSFTDENTHSQTPPHVNNTTSKVSTAPAESNYGNKTKFLNGTKNTQQLNYITHFQNYLSEQLLLCLQKSELFLQTTVSVQDMKSSHGVINLDGFKGVTNIKLICMEAGPIPDGLNKRHKSIAGVMFNAVRNSQQIFVSILNLDNIVCLICGINNPRLLWSQSSRFTDQFQTSSFPQQFVQFSLFPMMFTHDVSFWQTESDFDIGEMYDIIQNIAGDLVCSVDLIDLYTDPNTGQCSRCYRLYFMSHDLVLPYLVSWKLQSLIRMELSQKLHITLR